MAASSSWEVSAVEHQANMAQFQMAGPVAGKLPAQSARNVLLKSNLPANILAQVSPLLWVWIVIMVNKWVPGLPDSWRVEAFISDS